MLAVVIRDGVAAQEHIGEEFSALQDVVQGYIEPFFTERSPYGNGAITGYVNEGGLMHRLPIAFGIAHSPDYVVPLAGNAVIVGLTDDGESRGLTEQEAEKVLASYRPAPLGLCPIIEGDRDNCAGFVPVRGILSVPRLTA